MNGIVTAIEIVRNWSEQWLVLVIKAGAAAALLAAVVLVVNLILRRWLAPRQMGLLWGLVLLRLLLPVAPPSVCSLQNLWGCMSPAERPVTVPRPTGLDSQNVTAVRTLAGVDYPAPSSAPPASERSDVMPAVDRVINWINAALPLIWIVGAVAWVLRASIVHWRFCRRLKSTPECDDPRIRTLWENCCREAEVPTNTRILWFEEIQQPAVMGLFRPILLLPRDAMVLSDEQLRMIMLHELGHVRHWDIAANWILLAIGAAHWWNPVFWLASARFQSLREQACDAFALRRMSDESSRRYHELLLTLAERQAAGQRWRVALPVSILGVCSFFFPKHALRRRLTALKTAGTLCSRWQIACVAAFTGFVAVCGMTDASAPQLSFVPAIDWLPSIRPSWSGAVRDATEPDSSVTQTYDVEKTLSRIAADKRSEDPRQYMYWVLVHLLRGSTGEYDETTNAWAEERLKLDGSQLTITASPKSQEYLSKAIHAWEESGLGQTTVETFFMTANRDLATSLGVSWRHLEAMTLDNPETFSPAAKGVMPVVRAQAVLDDYLPIVVATIDSSHARTIMQSTEIERQRSFFSPKVTLFNGQLATLVDSVTRPYVVGVESVDQGPRRAKVAAISEGTRLTLRTIQSDDGKKIHVEGRIELSAIRDVRTASTMLRGEPTTIQIPRVKRCRIDISSDVPDGHSLLIGCMPAYEQKEYFYVFLTPRCIRDKDGIRY